LAAKAVRLHPGNPEVERLYLRVLVLNHDATVARPLGRKLLAARPHDFEFLYLNGILEREAGEYIAARQHLEEAIKLNPAHPNCRYNLGVVLAQLKDSAGARDQLEKSLALGATEPQVRFVLASVLRNLGATEPAQEQLKLYQQELQAATNSTLAAGKSRQAEEALTAGDAAKAVALYREAVEAKPDDALLDFKLALALDRTGDTAAEQAALDEAIRIDPTFALAQNQAGYMASNSGDFSSAEAHFRLAVQSAPGYAEAWLNLAAALGMESRFPEALDAVATSLKLDRNNPRALELQRGLANAQKQH
jgi:Flp pilus assembly protein TadD